MGVEGFSPAGGVKGGGQSRRRGIAEHKRCAAPTVVKRRQRPSVESLRAAEKYARQRPWRQDPVACTLQAALAPGTPRPRPALCSLHPGKSHPQSGGPTCRCPVGRDRCRRGRAGTCKEARPLRFASTPAAVSHLYPQGMRASCQRKCWLSVSVRGSLQNTAVGRPGCDKSNADRPAPTTPYLDAPSTWLA